MAAKIKVVNLQHEKANFTEIIIRNSITLIFAVILIVFSVSLFSIPGFEDVSSFMEYSVFVAKHKNPNWINILICLYHLIDVIFCGQMKKRERYMTELGRLT